MRSVPLALLSRFSLTSPTRPAQLLNLFIRSLSSTSNSTLPTTPKPIFAYGNANFTTIRRSNAFFVDNSRFIEPLHGWGRFLVMHRPPRFGKSLFLSMLGTYFDASVSDHERAELFKDLDIGRNPLPGAGKYIILNLDLSVDIDGDTADTISTRLYKKINNSIMETAIKYNLEITDVLGRKGILMNATNALASFGSLCQVVRAMDYPLYIIIDEYDHFSNKLLFEDPSLYHTLGVSTSGLRGFSTLCSIFEAIKEETTNMKPAG